MSRGHHSRRGVHVSARHRFRADSIDTTWRLRCDARVLAVTIVPEGA